MVWLEGADHDATPPGERLRALFERQQPLGAPGAFNALAALLAQRAGFEAMYVSGGALTASMGLPDLGIIGLDELCANVRTI
jgi:methylisocitrate lyase